MTEQTQGAGEWCTELGMEYADNGYGPRLPDRQYFYPPDGSGGITAQETCERLNALQRERDELQARVEALTAALDDSLQSWECTCSEDGFLADWETGIAYALGEGPLMCRWHVAAALLAVP